MCLNPPVWEVEEEEMDYFLRHLALKLQEFLVRFDKSLLYRLFIITNILDDNGDTITVRGCALDSGTLTTDTELVRMSHCGGFYYDNR